MQANGQLKHTTTQKYLEIRRSSLPFIPFICSIDFNVIVQFISSIHTAITMTSVALVGATGLVVSRSFDNPPDCRRVPLISQRAPKSSPRYSPTPQLPTSIPFLADSPPAQVQSSNLLYRSKRHNGRPNCPQSLHRPASSSVP